MKPTVLNVLHRELNLITEPVVYRFVLNAFNHMCPDYFWTIPVSIKGHHPPICRTRGGLVHHVKLAVAFADMLLDADDIDKDDPRYSQTIAGVMLHDMLKRGSDEDELVTFPDHQVANKSHGRYCAFTLEENMYIPPEVEVVIKAIHLHLGRWTMDVTPAELADLQYNEVVRITHLADYMASRALHQLLAERCLDKTMGYLND